MIDQILDSLCRDSAIPHEGRADFLRSLRNPLKRLRASYQTSNPEVDYADRKIQQAYMLAYYPGHTKLIERCMLDFAWHSIKGVKASGRSQTPIPALPRKEVLSVCFLGAGPAPELVGLLQRYVAEEFLPSNLRVKKLVAHLLDLRSEEWTPSRKITIDSLVPLVWREKDLTIYSHAIELFGGSVPKEILQSSDLIISQNFWNEIKDRSLAVGAFRDIAGRLRVNQAMLTIDLSNYQSTKELLATFSREAQQLGVAVQAVAGVQYLSSAEFTPPEIVLENLLTEEPGLMRRRKVEYSALWLRRYT